MVTKMARSSCLAVMLIAGGLSFQSRAYAGAAIGATEPTQLLNNIQLIASYIEQVTTAANNVIQVEQEVANLVRAGIEPFYAVKNRLDDVRDVVKDGLSLAYSLENIDQVFLDKYKNFEDFAQGNYDRVAFVEDIREWTGTTEDSIKNALEAAGLQLESLDEEENIMSQLYAKAQSADGRQQALDVANEVAHIGVRQMQSLRQLVATDMQIKAAYFQQETAIRKMSEAASAEYFDPLVAPPTPLPNLDGGTGWGFGDAAGATPTY